MIFGFFAELCVFGSQWNYFLYEKSRAGIAGRIVFQVAVTADFCALGEREVAGVDKDGNERRDLLFIDKIVQDDRHAESAVGLHRAAAVQKDHEWKFKLRIKAGRKINPIATRSARVDFAFGKCEFGDHAL